jgi:FdhD protein
MTRTGRARVPVTRIGSGTPVTADDELAIEEPLEIRLRAFDEPAPGAPVTVTMRTPGHDEDLAIGFLRGEGMIRSLADVAHVGPCGTTQQVVSVQLAVGTPDPRPDLRRNFYTTSSCGVCGKSSIDAVRALIPEQSVADTLRIDVDVLREWPRALLAHQALFASTGGLHAAALMTATGELLAIREDVGRHNATDKLLGAELRAGGARPRNAALLLSGRASFELVQKAAVAGIEFVAAIGAPSSLAVELASSLNMTLVGFLRNVGFNVYCGAQRITTASKP